MTDDELYLYVTNDGKIYREQIRPLHQELAGWKASGNYQRAVAISRFLSIVNRAADKYRREFTETKAARFSPQNRRSTAEALVDYFETEHALGNIPGSSPGSTKKSKAQLDREIDESLRGNNPRRRRS